MTLLDNKRLEAYCSLEDRKESSIERSERYARQVASMVTTLGSVQQAVRAISEETGRNVRTLYDDIAVSRAFADLPDDFQRLCRAGAVKTTKDAILTTSSCPPKIRNKILTETERTGNLTKAVARCPYSIPRGSRTDESRRRVFTELPHRRSVSTLKLDALGVLAELQRRVKIIGEEVEDDGTIQAAIILIQDKLRNL